MIALAVDIRYWDRGAWGSYVRGDVLPLYRSSLTLLELEISLKELVHGRMLSDVIKMKPSVEVMFVGGTSPPEIYEDRGLANIYSMLLGASIKLREYYFLKAHGKEPKTICTITRTQVMNYVEHIAILLERVVNHAASVGLIATSEIKEAQSDSKTRAKDVLTKPESLPERFTEFLANALKITVAYNQYTRFIWHLRKIPKKFIKEFYPEMLKPDVFQLIQELLGLREYITPTVEDQEIADLYTIFAFDHAVAGGSKINVEIDGIRDYVIAYLTGSLPSINPNNYPYVTIGGCLCRVNELIWGLFELYYVVRNALKLVIEGEVPTPFSEWKNVAGKQGRFGIIELPYPNSYEVLSKLDEVLPAVFTGELELIMNKGEKLFLYPRW